MALSKKCLEGAGILDALPAKTLSEEAQAQAIVEAVGEIGRRKTWSDIGLELVSNSYLSGTMTPIANALSIGIQSLLRPTTHGIGVLTDRLGLTQGNRHWRDTRALWQGALEGFGADLHFLREGYLRGYPIDIDKSLNEIAIAQGRKLSDVKQDIVDAYARRQVLDEKIKEGTPEFTARFEALNKRQPTKEEELQYVHEGYDYIRKAIGGKKGEVIRIPTRVTVALDEYGKARFRRMRMYQMMSEKARREATDKDGNLDAEKYVRLIEGEPGVPQSGWKYQLGLSNTAEKDIQKKIEKITADQLKAELNAGKITQDKVKERTAEIRREVTNTAKGFSRMRNELGDLFGVKGKEYLPYETVREFALDNTFQSRTYGFVAQIMKIKREGGDVQRMLMGTMIPFVKTPWNILKEGITYVPGVPLVKGIRPMYAQGGTPVKMNLDELIPRQILGTSMFAGVMALQMSGRITGAPQSAEEAQSWRDQGIAPFAIKFGELQVPYQRLEPVATVIGLSSDLTKAFQEWMNHEDPSKESVRGFYEEVIADTLTAMKYHIMSKSFMEGFATLLEFATDPARMDEKFATQLLRPLTPALMNEAARLMDPYERQASTPLEKLQQRIPGARELLPVEYGLFGGPRETNAMQAFTGFGIISESERNPLQRELARLKFTKGRVGDRVKNVDLTNEQLARYRQLTAEIVTPVLNRAITTPSYPKQSDAKKRVLLERKVETAKRVARSRFVNELKKSDPEMAQKFKNAFYIKQGAPEKAK